MASGRKSLTGASSRTILIPAPRETASGPRRERRLSSAQQAIFLWWDREPRRRGVGIPYVFTLQYGYWATRPACRRPEPDVESAAPDICRPGTISRNAPKADLSETALGAIGGFGNHRILRRLNILGSRDTPDADRRWPDSSRGKGYAVPATSSGAVLRRASDRRHGSSRCGPGDDPPGAVGSRLERIGHRSGAEIPRPLRHHGVVLSRRPEWPRPRCALERAAGHARPA